MSHSMFRHELPAGGELFSLAKFDTLRCWAAPMLPHVPVVRTLLPLCALFLVRDFVSGKIAMDASWAPGCGTS